MKKIVYSAFLFLLLPLHLVQAYTFTRTLTLGSIGDDVLELQKFLNLESSTRVSLIGPGSPGYESLYFGEKTKKAVVAFQNKYAQEILIPNGLFEGTGFVGNSTLSVLNSITSNISINTPTQVNAPNTPTLGLTPTIINQSSNIQTGFIVSPSNVKADQDIFVGSTSDISQLLFSIGSIEVDSECFTINTCKIRVPKNVLLGPIEIKTTDSQFGSQKIFIISPEEKKPTINTKVISLTGENIITGKNFGAQMNIYTPFGAYTTETLNNSFILQYPQPNSYATSSGFFFIENINGLQSDILTLPYEK